MAAQFPLERLELEPMASGNRSIRLTKQVSWEDFPEYAQSVVAFLGGAIVRQADSVVERVWTVRIDGRLFWISFDDFGLGISLDPQDAEASRLIPDIRRRLLARRDGEGTG